MLGVRLTNVTLSKKPRVRQGGSEVIRVKHNTWCIVGAYYILTPYTLLVGIPLQIGHILGWGDFFL